jgi:hypothetical protein
MQGVKINERIKEDPSKIRIKSFWPSKNHAQISLTILCAGHFKVMDSFLLFYYFTDRRVTIDQMDQ